MPTAALVLITLPVLIFGLGYAIDSGFFDRLIDRFVDDQGSAVTRVIMLKLFTLVPTMDLLLGPDQDMVSSLQRSEGIALGIESFWVSFIMQNGIIMCAMFFTGFLLFCLQLVRATRPSAVLPLALFFVTISGAVSLASKSTLMGIFVALLMITMRGPPARESGKQAYR